LSQSSVFKLYIEIVDNASPNESYAYLLKKFAGIDNVCVDASPSNSGFAIGNNLGLKRLESLHPDYALILNNDVHFNLKILEKLDVMYCALTSPGAIAPLQMLPGNQLARFATLKCNTFWDDMLVYSRIVNRFKKPHEYQSNTAFANTQEVDIIPGCFIFIDFELFRRIGYFDESTFLFCEERFLYRRLHDAGKKNYLILDENYVHEHSKTINAEADNRLQTKWLTDGRIAFTRKYRKYATLKVFLIRTAYHLSNVMACVVRILKRLQ